MRQLIPVPAGSGSFSVTLVAVPVPTALLLLTVTVYPITVPAITDATSAVLPMLRAGTAMMVVGSLYPAEADPPPDTATWLVTCDAAFAASFTVTVIGG
jgi:hypothetical protein